MNDTIGYHLCSMLPMAQTVLQELQADHVLLDQLRLQVEYYFSCVNLCRDTFLQSLLASTDHIGAVPTNVIASFSKIRFICRASHPVDPRLIASCLKDSKVVTISEDGKYIIPNQIPDFRSVSIQSGTHHQHQQRRFICTPSPPPSSPLSYSTSASSSVGSIPVAPGLPSVPQLLPTTTATKERTTVIVRDLPTDCTEEELLEVFTTDKNGPPKSLQRLGIGSTWYVSFAKEEYAVHAVATSWGKTLRGYPVQARMKSEVPVQVAKQSEGYLPMLRPRTHSQARKQQQSQQQQQQQVMMLHSAAPHELYPDYSRTPGSAYSFTSYDSPSIFMTEPKGSDPSDCSSHSYHSPASLPIPGEIPLESTIMGRKKRYRAKRSRRRRATSVSVDGSDASSIAGRDSTNSSASKDCSNPTDCNNNNMPNTVVGNNQPQQNQPVFSSGQHNKPDNGVSHMNYIGILTGCVTESNVARSCHSSSHKVQYPLHDNII